MTHEDHRRYQHPLFIHTHRHTQTHTQTQTDTQTHTDTHTDTHTQTHRHTTAATLRIAGGEVPIGAAYLTHGLGTSGPNLGRLASIVAFMSRITFPWCLLGDWNVEPDDLRDVGFLENLEGALIWTPCDTRSTCTLSPFRLLDYAVISPSFQVLSRSMTPWHTHLGLEITLSREAKTFQCQELALPRPFVQPMAENKKAGWRGRPDRRRRSGPQRVLTPLIAERDKRTHLAHLSFSSRP